MKYNCIECNFSTDDRRSWFKHTKTIKHSRLTENIKEKESNLLLHNEIKFLREKINILENQSQETFLLLNKQLEDKNKQLEDKNRQLEDKNKQLENKDRQIEEIKKELNETKNKLDNQYEKHIDTLKDENIYKNQIITQAGNIVQNSMSTLSFVVKNYPNAPPLEKISNYDFILTNKNKFIKELAHNNRKKIVDDFLGKIIVGIYKKNDPKIQSLWSSDVSRQNYVIKNIANNKIIKIENNPSKWINDKNGVKLKKTVIKPFLEQVKSIGEQFIEENKIDNEEDSDDQDNNENLEVMIQIADINKNIKNELLEKEICKLIAPYFQPDK